MTEVLEIQLALGFFLSLAMMSLVYISSGAWVRRRPALFFSLGVFVAISGVLIVTVVDGIIDIIGFSPIKVQISNVDHVLKYAKFTKEIIEIGFAAAGAGLITLAMDIRSAGKLDEEKVLLLNDEKQYEEELALTKAAPTPVTEADINRRADHSIRLQKTKRNLERRRKGLFGE